MCHRKRRSYPSTLEIQRSFLGSATSFTFTSSSKKLSTTTSGVVVDGALIAASSDISPRSARELENGLAILLLSSEVQE